MWVIAISNKKCCEKKKNAKKIIQTDSAQVGIKGAPPQGNLHRKFVCFYSGSVELQMHENDVFFTPVKYILVYCVPWVSWAARHTSVCLDL